MEKRCSCWYNDISLIENFIPYIQNQIDFCDAKPD